MAKAILGPFEVSEEEIGRLDATQLQQLIKRLVQSDLQRAGIPFSAAQGTLRINVSDGGEDVRVEWAGAASSTNYIPKRFTVFQLKAENLTDQKLKREPVDASTGKLKPAISAVVDHQGSYTLITNKTNVTTPKRKKPSGELITPKLDNMREILRTVIQAHNTKASDIEIDVYGPPKIADWVNCYPMTAVWVKQILGIASSDFPFQTLEWWSQYQSLSETAVVSWPKFNEHLGTIQERLAIPGQVIRLLGHSGIGKSRLTLEAIQDTTKEPGTDLDPFIAYAKEFTPDLLKHVRDFVRNKQRVVLVIDECPPDGHRQLSDEVHRNDSQLSMISLDLEFKEPPPTDYKMIIDAAPPDAIKAILTSSVTFSPPEDADRATQFCSGFPLIAVLVAKALRDGAEHFANFKDQDHVVDRLVWGRGTPNADLLGLIRAIALFEAVGVISPKNTQLEWVAKELVGMTADQLESKLEHFRDRRILQQRGFSVLVTPRPLAAQLAASFWRNATQAQKRNLLSGTMPDELKEALCERLSDLNYLEDARSIAAQLCSKSGPFGSAEALNTETGARCLRKLAEVAPEEAISAIERSFSDWTIPELKSKLGPGRRWLVWTLEALSWEPVTFDRTIRFLLRLAASENEDWSNNASAEFVQRFRIQLPGTSVSLADRLNSLKLLLTDAESDEIPIILSALTGAISSEPGTRALGSEHHGTRKTYSDYQPKLWQEIFDYANGILDLIVQIVAAEPAQLGATRSAMANANLNYLAAPAVFPHYQTAIQALKPADRTWSELLGHLSWSIRHHFSDPKAKQTKEKLRALFESLMPQSLEERILFYVKSVPYGFVTPDEPEDEDFELNRKRAETLAHECADDWEIFKSVARGLSRGETRESFAFGRALFENSNYAQNMIRLALKELVAVSGQDPNPSLLGGMLFALLQKDQEEAQRLLIEISTRDEVLGFLPYFSSTKLTDENLALVIDALSSKRLPPSAVEILGMGRVLHNVSFESVRNLIRTLKDVGTDGAWVALDLLGMYLHGADDRFLAVRDDIVAILHTKDLLNHKPKRTMAGHHYESLARRVLQDPQSGPQFAEFLANTFLELAREARLGSDLLIKHLSTILLTQYTNIVLPIFADRIEKFGKRDAWALTFVLGAPFSFKGKEEGPFFKLPVETIIAACEAYPNNFAVLIAEILPLFRVLDDGKRQWTNVASEMLSRFGRRKDILDAFSINLGTGGWSGPTSSYLASFLPPLQELSAHPHSNVRRWANEKASQIGRQLKHELAEEEESTVRRSLS